MKQNIVVNAMTLLSPRSGIARYTCEVSRKLLEEAESERLFFHYGYGHKKELICGDGVEQEERRSGLQRVRDMLVSRPLLKRISRKVMTHVARRVGTGTYDLYWEPNFIPNDAIASRTCVVSVHDFSFQVHPEWHPRERVEHFRRHFYSGIARADAVVTGSEYTRGEIETYLGIPSERIRVIYHGVDRNIYRRYDERALQKSARAFGLSRPFLLFVGSIEPRKNLLRLIEAYRALPEALQREYDLILAGGHGWNNDAIRSAIEGSKGRVRYVGSVDDVTLAHLYNLATAFVYPSLYEGFGIPPLEAMACETPVVVSRVTSLPEVCGDAACYVDPLDVESIREGLARILEDKTYRQTLQKRALPQASRFSWSSSAQSHMELFRQILTS